MLVLVYIDPNGGFYPMTAVIDTTGFVYCYFDINETFTDVDLNFSFYKNLISS